MPTKIYVSKRSGVIKGAAAGLPPLQTKVAATATADTKGEGKSQQETVGGQKQKSSNDDNTIYSGDYAYALLKANLNKKGYPTGNNRGSLYPSSSLVGLGMTDENNTNVTATAPKTQKAKADTPESKRKHYATRKNARDIISFKIDSFLQRRSCNHFIIREQVMDYSDVLSVSSSDSNSSGEKEEKETLTLLQIDTTSNINTVTTQMENVETAATKATKHKQYSWDYYFAQLILYKRELGHVDIPPGHLLYTWIQQNIVHFEFLSTEQIDKLQKLGVMFNLVMFRQLMNGTNSSRRLDGFGTVPDSPPKKEKSYPPDKRQGDDGIPTIAAALHGLHRQGNNISQSEDTMPKDKAGEMAVERADVLHKKSLPASDADEKKTADKQQGKSHKMTATSAVKGCNDEEKKLSATDPNSANNSENDVDNKELCHRPLTMMGSSSQLTSGCVMLTLPPLPQKLGLVVEFNPIFGYPEVKRVSIESPLIQQIPENFWTETFITSIEVDDRWSFVPESVQHCIDIFTSARRRDAQTRLIVNFAKNPMAIYFPNYSQ